MARRKSTSRKASKDKLVASAIRLGTARADEAARARRKAIARRKAAVARVQRAARREPPALASHLKRAAGPAASAGTLVAEGDSWFDYPLWDVLKMLEDEHGFDVESVAHKGDRVEDMAYGPGQLDAFCRLVEKLIRSDRVPRAILLSGGGNDIAGDEFGVLLNHAGSPIAGLNDDVVTGVIDQRIRLSYVTMITQVTRLCQNMLGRKLPIVTHGYAHAVPDGRGFLGGWGPLPGPWLKPGFSEKGFGDLDANTATVGKLIDRFNGMLRDLPRIDGFEHVKWVDLRNTLSSGPSYKADWGNELHPTKSGFSRVADAFAAVL